MLFDLYALVPVFVPATCRKSQKEARREGASGQKGLPSADRAVIGKPRAYLSIAVPRAANETYAIVVAFG